jgi:hypothetical protein
MALIPLGVLSAAVSIAVQRAGYIAIGSGETTVNKFLFPTDTRTTLATGVSLPAQYMGNGMANSNVAGYQTGFDGTSNAVNKFAFPSDTRTTLGTGLATPRYLGTGFSNSGVAGYFAGGASQPAGGALQSSVEKYTFPSDTRSTLATGMSSNRREIGGFENVAVAGYIGPGWNGGSPGRTTTVDKFAFPSDTRSTLGTGTSSDFRDGGAMCNIYTAGYYNGGTGAGNTTIVDKFAYPSDTRSTLGTGLSSARSLQGGMGDPGIAGYFAGRTTTVDKFAFPSDTRTTLAAGLSGGGEGVGAFSNGGIV